MLIHLDPAGIDKPARPDVPPALPAATSGTHRRRLMFVFGTRPEAIKLAPVITQLRNQTAAEVVVCVTAQHRQMLDQVLQTFDIKPDIDLDVMQPGQTLREGLINAAATGPYQ